jgi:uncharacterized protein YbbK (DUF523 family)
MFTKIKIHPFNPAAPKDVGKNQCPSCGKVFRSLYAFDAHRTGSHGVDRRCLSSEEMLSAGMLESQNMWVTRLNDRPE